MEQQQIFNQLMENAIVYLQDKGYLPKQPAQQQQQNGIDWENPDPKKVNEIIKDLKETGVFPK